MSTGTVNNGGERVSTLKVHDQGILCGLTRAECVALIKAKRYPVESPEWRALQGLANDLRDLKEEAEREGVSERLYSGKPDIRDAEEIHLEESREAELTNGR